MSCRAEGQPRSVRRRRTSDPYAPDAQEKFNALPQRAKAAYTTMIGHIAANPSVGSPQKSNGEGRYERGNLAISYTMMGRGTHFTITDLR